MVAGLLSFHIIVLILYSALLEVQMIIWNQKPNMHVCMFLFIQPIIKSLTTVVTVIFEEINRKTRNKTVYETKHRATRPPQMWWFSNNYSLLSKGQEKINGFLLTCFAQRNWQQKRRFICYQRDREGGLCYNSQTFTWHSKQKPKDIHSVWECGIFIFLSNRCMHWLRPPDTILDLSN